MSDLVERLFESDAASALTNEAAREIERLHMALEALRAIEALGSDGEHSGERHAICRAIARYAVEAMGEKPHPIPKPGQRPSPDTSR